MDCHLILGIGDVVTGLKMKNIFMSGRGHDLLSKQISVFLPVLPHMVKSDGQFIYFRKKSVKFCWAKIKTFLAPSKSDLPQVIVGARKPDLLPKKLNMGHLLVLEQTKNKIFESWLDLTFTF